MYQIGRILVQFKGKKVSIWRYHHFKGPSWLFSLLPRHLTEELSAQQQSFLMQWEINSWNILLTVPTAYCSSYVFKSASAVPVQNILFGTDYLVKWGVHRSSSKPPEVLTDSSGLPWWYQNKFWMITSVLSEPDHKNQWERTPSAADSAALQQ